VDTKLRRRAVGVIAAVVLVVTTLAGIVGSAGVAGASVSNSQHLPPIYSYWAQNLTNWPCYATPSYACTQGGYSAAAAESSGWPWSTTVTTVPATGEAAQPGDSITAGGPHASVVWRYGDPLGSNPGPYYCCFPSGPGSSSDYSGSAGRSGQELGNGTQVGGFYLDERDC